jgi:hypothetical protein
MKKITGVLCFALAFHYGHGQSKVFREVSKDIETKIETITQDNSLVGYLVFTKLEKLSTDSFRYKLSFLDENLNDIGNYSFSNQNLQIQDVAFDNDVLCVGYLRNDAPEEIKSRDFAKKIKKVKSSVYLQFLNLNGQLLNDHSEAVNATYTEFEFVAAKMYFTTIAPVRSFKGSLTTPIRIKNIPGTGFCVTYAESKFVNGSKISDPNSYFNAGNKQWVRSFDYSGKNIWEKQLPDSKIFYSITLASASNIYILRKSLNKDVIAATEGGFDLLSLRASDGHISKSQKLAGQEGNTLKVLNFSNEVNQNSPVVSGLIVKENIATVSEKKIAKGQNMGVFTLNAEDSVFTTKMSYWSKGEYKPQISKKSYLTEIRSYPGLNYSFTDPENNTYFVGTGIKKKTRWGSIAAAVITAPLLVPPIYIFALGGSVKYRYQDAVILKQDPKGKLSFHANLESNNSKKNRFSLSSFKDKSYFTVNQSKNLVLNDEKSIFIYDIPSKTVLKKIAHKEDGVKTEIFKAKEGHIMIAEYNANDKSTKLSIEAL